MNPDLLLGLLAGALAAALVAYIAVRALLRARAGIVRDAADRPFLNQLLACFAGMVERRRGRDAALDARLSELETLVRQAGGAFLGGATAAEVFVARWVFPVLSTLVLLIVLPLLRVHPGLITLAVALFAVMLWKWPESALRDLAAKRARAFVRQLPGALDVMRLISQSGGDLFSGIVAVTQVTTTLAQSIEMGTSVSDNLRSASELIRRQARSRAQERAQKAVVNMSFPLLLLILPGVFIVLLAPLVIQFLASR